MKCTTSLRWIFSPIHRTFGISSESSAFLGCWFREPLSTMEKLYFKRTPSKTLEGVLSRDSRKGDLRNKMFCRHLRGTLKKLLGCPCPIFWRKFLVSTGAFTLRNFTKIFVELLFIVLLNLNDVLRDMYEDYVKCDVYFVFLLKKSDKYKSWLNTKKKLC